MVLKIVPAWNAPAQNSTEFGRAMPYTKKRFDQLRAIKLSLSHLPRRASRRWLKNGFQSRAPEVKLSAKLILAVLVTALCHTSVDAKIAANLGAPLRQNVRTQKRLGGSLQTRHRCPWQRSVRTPPRNCSPFAYNRLAAIP